MKRLFLKALLWLARAAATIAVLLALFYVEEDWRGAHDWTECQKELQAKGELLDPQQLAPPGKPENDLTKVPIFAELFQQDYTRARLYHLSPFLESGNTDSLPSPTTNLTKGKPIDLASWQKYYRSSLELGLPPKVGSPAQDVLTRLRLFDPELTEIDSAVQNPESYWPLDCATPQPPFKEDRLRAFIRILNTYSSIDQVLQMQGIAHLENGESDKAEHDFLFIQRLSQSILRSPFTLNSLVATGVQSVDEGLLWEGIRRHAWKGDQLNDMEAQMALVDFLKSYREALRFERAVSIQSLSFVEQKQPIPWPYPEGDKNKWDEEVLFFYLAPQGRVDQTKSYFCRETQKAIEAIDLNRGTLDAAEFPESEKFLMVPFLDVQGLRYSGHQLVWCSSKECS